MQLNRNERITMVRKNLGFLIDVQKVHVHEYAVMTYDQYNAALKLYSEKKQKLPND
jgi:hypothetical protein